MPVSHSKHSAPMHYGRRARLAAFSLVASFALVAPAWAVIQALIPLQSLIDDSEQIVLLEVERVDPDRPSMTLRLKEEWKGTAGFEQLPVNLTGDKEKHTPKLLKRVAPRTPVIAFIRKQDKRSQMMLAFTNGTWFQVMATTDGKTTRWGFTHCEIYLRRTFRGTTEELQTVVKDVLAGKRKAPSPDTRAMAGFGPEIEAEAKAKDASK
ncbi:MAG: hypothetical protein IT428_17040 [Planctomycetaceae bacterium]|nr:hypothetical protein [Planctomycetaceae bacterium]